MIMGAINVEGIGIVEIKGDTPDIQEQAAIINSLPKKEVIPIEPKEKPVASANIPPKAPQSGPLEVVQPQTRENVRKAVEEQPGLAQFFIEAGPAIAGAAAGAAAGAPFFPPVGPIIGAIAGGVGGELLAQETGIAPESGLNVALSAAGPLIGPTVGTVFRGSRRVTGAAITHFPGARVARAKNQIAAAAEEFESIGTKILSKQKGLQTRSASELYEAVRRSGIKIPNTSLNNTIDSINGLINEMDAIKAFPEVRQSINVLRQTLQTLRPETQIGIGAMLRGDKTITNVSLDTIVNARQQIGIAVRKAQTAGGIKLGSAKKVFKSISNDLDKISIGSSLKGGAPRAARLAKSAIKRAKLEFSIKDMEAGVARFVKDTDKGKTINITGFQKWFADLTNPKSKKFNKNFTAALKDEIPTINERLSSLLKIVEKTKGFGGGGLVIRGQLAKAGGFIIGGLLGFLGGGPLGGGIGALAGARLPETMTAIFMSKAGAAFLERAAKLGKGSINLKTWITAGEIAARAAGEGKETPFTPKEFNLPPGVSEQ